MQIRTEIEYDRGNQIGVGQGMNSEVFLADDPQLGGQFVAKEIAKSRLLNDVTLYFCEAQAMFAVDHPNIVPIQYASQTSTHVILTMPYYPNGSLGRRITAGPLDVRELVRVSLGILSGLEAIHIAGFVHFDLKPSNVLFDSIDTPLVADFGQARRISPSGSVTVPPLYPGGIPPEAYVSATGNYLSDIYQVGLLLYRAANGDAVYQRQIAGLDDATIRSRVIAGKLPDRNLFLPHVPKRVRTIIRKALQADPLKRYPSAHDLAVAIGRVPCDPVWHMNVDTTGNVSWRAQRAGRADLQVELKKNGSAAWDVGVYTISNGTIRRAKDPQKNERFGLAEASAMKHLTEVFRHLV